MSYFIKPAFLIGCWALSSTAAFAHAGHLGELAGHSHWVGVAAVAGAAIIAGLAAKAKKRAASKEDGTRESADGADVISPEEPEAEPV
ncbi:hypothetical protein PsAD2_02025 [Pseudovibrio axinellae]|uniref:Uncharacterized protein n=1 Tax=Pseudovibrio axinellae TaxID=989403 RepID=A0A165YVM2_9HYPH|nr:DUF6732 family protein [Pseudovibrio axinellae]KZL19274.1 hypothetical protein PsAD2_02025 [Pseudovibrio axinellae]SEQ43289.1 hypothetical protein SAMN05421798_102682 [Pseudovibrio axinellae]